jgi:hypothetical protein
MAEDVDSAAAAFAKTRGSFSLFFDASQNYVRPDDCPWTLAARTRAGAASRRQRRLVTRQRNLKGLPLMADPPGTIRRIPDPHAEMHRLGRERQAAAGQICAEEGRACDADCEIGAFHCVWHHQPHHKQGYHDPDHCDRVWAGA